MSRVSLAAPAQSRLLLGPRPAGEIGRPALAGSSVVFTRRHAARSAIELVDLGSGRRRTLRAAARDAALFYPSLLGGQLLFERITRCCAAAAHRLGALSVRRAPSPGIGGARATNACCSAWPRRSRATAASAGYTHAYNSASNCPNRGAGRGGATQLGSTALGAAGAYVTSEDGPMPAGMPRIVTIGRR